MPKTVKSKFPGDHRGNAAYPVRLDPEDRANLERLHDSIEGVSRTTLLKALLRMSMGAALAEPEVLARHVLRPKATGVES